MKDQSPELITFLHSLIKKTMTKEEQLKIYSAYLPYKLKINDAKSPIERELTHKGYWYRSSEDDTVFISIDEAIDNNLKPILYCLSNLTKEELISVGFTDHIDYLTDEREGWIEKYGFDEYMNKIPHGHFQYLVSKHYNVFGLPEGEYINKATLTK